MIPEVCCILGYCRKMGQHSQREARFCLSLNQNRQMDSQLQPKVQHQQLSATSLGYLLKGKNREATFYITFLFLIFMPILQVFFLFFF